MSSHDLEDIDQGKRLRQAEKATSDAVEDAADRVRDETRQFAAETRAAGAKALGRTAKEVRATESRSADLIAQIRDRAQFVGERVGPAIRDNPYRALGLAAVAGLALGVLFGRARR